MGRTIIFAVCLGFFLVNGKLAQEERACDNNWQYFNGHCYTWHRTKTEHYQQSEKQCQKLNSSLAMVEWNDTQEFLRTNVLKSDSNFWSGLHRCHSVKFYWTDGTPVNYEHFARGEPNDDEGNEHCVELYPDTTWNDQTCSLRQAFVCKNATCSNDSVSESCCYKHELMATWFEAKRLCETTGDELVKIPNSVTNTMVRNAAKGVNTWIGLKRLDYLCWDSGKVAVLNKVASVCKDWVNKCHCVSIGNDGSWSEASCMDDLPFVCEKDANECKDPNNVCHVNAICTNTVGSYACHCKHGFIGNGKTCEEPKDFDIKQINTADMDEVKSVIKTCSSILGRESESETVIKVLEALTVSAGQQMNESSTENFVIMKEENLIIGVFRVKTKEFQGLTYPSNEEGLENNEDEIAFPASIFSHYSEDSAVIVGMVYDTPSDMNDTIETEWFVNSKIIGGIINPELSASLNDPVKIEFRLLKYVENAKAKCVFWKFKAGAKGMWSSDGCHVTNFTTTHVSCECYHLTNFAILMRVDSDQTSSTDNGVLDIITYVGLSTSIVGCLLTLLIHLYFRKLRKGRGFIHINLVIALGTADIVFFVAIFTDQDHDSCLAMAILVLYFFLSLFFWMLVEGVHIYLMVKKVFDIRGRKIKYIYCTIGWVFPLVIVLVTYGVLRSEFLSDEYCWLSIKSGAIWAFVGPITLIILVNVIIMMLVLRCTVTMLPDDPENGKIMSAFRTFLMLTPILGVTWIFGILTITKDSNVFQYLFAIFNSFQGLIIFILYCVFNKEARRELQRKVKTIRSSREISISRKRTSTNSKEKGAKVSGTSSKSSFRGTPKKNSELSEPQGRYTPWYVLSTSKIESRMNDGFENESPKARKNAPIEYGMRHKRDVTGQLFYGQDTGPIRDRRGSENVEKSIPEIYPLENSEL